MILPFHFKINNNEFITQDWTRMKSRLSISLADSSVKIPINIHTDDASMVSTKMWKSGSVVGMQVR